MTCSRPNSNVLIIGGRNHDGQCLLATIVIGAAILWSGGNSSPTDRPNIDLQQRSSYQSRPVTTGDSSKQQQVNTNCSSTTITPAAPLQTTSDGGDGDNVTERTRPRKHMVRICANFSYVPCNGTQDGAVLHCFNDGVCVELGTGNGDEDDSRQICMCQPGYHGRQCREIETPAIGRGVEADDGWRDWAMALGLAVVAVAAGLALLARARCVWLELRGEDDGPQETTGTMEAKDTDDAAEGTEDGQPLSIGDRQRLPRETETRLETAGTTEATEATDTVEASDVTEVKSPVERADAVEINDHTVSAAELSEANNVVVVAEVMKGKDTSETIEDKETNDAVDAAKATEAKDAVTASVVMELKPRVERAEVVGASDTARAAEPTEGDAVVVGAKVTKDKDTAEVTEHEEPVEAAEATEAKHGVEEAQAKEQLVETAEIAEAESAVDTAETKATEANDVAKAAGTVESIDAVGVTESARDKDGVEEAKATENRAGVEAVEER